LRDRITALFQALAINATYRMLPIGYDTDTSQSDIKQLLDDIADKSRILRMPEQQPEFWQTYRLPTLTDAEKEQINTYRRKFGLTLIWRMKDKATALSISIIGQSGFFDEKHSSVFSKGFWREMKTTSAWR
jgi:hypothetical protein